MVRDVFNGRSTAFSIPYLYGVTSGFCGKRRFYFTNRCQASPL